MNDDDRYSGLSDEEKGRLRAFDAERQHFYSLIGHCITRFQSVEDYLEDVFTAALANPEARAKAIFEVARSLEQKINLITAALVDREPAFSERWTVLRGRVTRVAAARNSIAHARPVNHAGTIRIVTDENGNTRSIERTEPPRMELHKERRGETTTWKIDTLRAEHGRSSELFRSLIAFKHRLAGEAVPGTLAEDAVR